MNKLVRLWKRPSRDGKCFSYVLIYRDEQGKTRYASLGHTDRQKALRQCAKKERELQMGYVEPGFMRIHDLLEDSLHRSRGSIAEGTYQEYDTAVRQFVQVVSDVDYRSICQEHGEQFMRACISNGNRPATVAKKIATLKRQFNLAVERNQLEDNPFRHLKKPKTSDGEIHVYSDEECDRLVKAARDLKIGKRYRWDMILLTDLCTGMRRGELLNTTWRDVDFAGQKINVAPKDDTEKTWIWKIKDKDRRSLPLTDEVVNMLIEHQAAQPEGYPYVFVTPKRYDNIQKLRRLGRWSIRQGKCPVSNFQYHFQKILAHAGIEEGTFHDLRRTCITNWFAYGLTEYEVMILAGHASFETTRRFYMAVRKDIIERARKASAEALQGIFVAHALRAPVEGCFDKTS
jgi:integrase